MSPHSLELAEHAAQHFDNDDQVDAGLLDVSKAFAYCEPKREISSSNSYDK